VAKSDISRFECPNCRAEYKLVRVEPESKSVDRQITCRACGAPFHSREDGMVLKYFLVRRPRVLAPVHAPPGGTTRGFGRGAIG
jgi:DNA-directed RNA polymerase subunit RPC12/RpoP